VIPMLGFLATWLVIALTGHLATFVRLIYIAETHPDPPGALGYLDGMLDAVADESARRWTLHGLFLSVAIWLPFVLYLSAD
jgi:hypothetical protein